MLAKALQSILPPLNREEILEVTHLHSLASPDYEQLVVARPFRSPHHSASHVAITGGGSKLRPGEISLAHRGVLFFDELPEFNRETLEALRQPLEDRVISLARARSRIEFPANFILVATANPCPCGYNGSGKACRCLASQLLRYRNRLSGPILDRIDLYSSVHEVQHDQLLGQVANPEADALVRQNISDARTIQAQRFKSPSKLNTDMTNEDLKRLAHLDPDAESFLNETAKKFNISARAYMRTVKVARTIADLGAAESINEAHITEALSYRSHALNKDSS
jgi:magnesium chelatase family protein